MGYIVADKKGRLLVGYHVQDSFAEHQVGTGSALHFAGAPAGLTASKSHPPPSHVAQAHRSGVPTM